MPSYQHLDRHHPSRFHAWGHSSMWNLDLLIRCDWAACNLPHVASFMAYHHYYYPDSIAPICSVCLWYWLIPTQQLVKQYQALHLHLILHAADKVCICEIKINKTTLHAAQGAWICSVISTSVVRIRPFLSFNQPQLFSVSFLFFSFCGPKLGDPNQSRLCHGNYRY